MSKIHYRAYFDCAATTPVAPEVFKAMAPYFSDEFGNPGSLHFAGQKAQAALDASRKKIADFFKVEFTGVVFFSSATEVNNFVVQGIIKQTVGRESPTKPHIIVSKTEHASVLKTAEHLESVGLAEVSYLDVDRNSLVNQNQLKKLLKKETVLVSVMLVNNETGAIQPLREISKVIKEFRSEKLRLANQAKFKLQDLQFPIFHSDAVQGLGHLSLNNLVLQNLGVDLMTFSGHKIYGPKGIGALVSNISGLSAIFEPIIRGGSQEFGWRPGTENIPAIVGFAKACEMAIKKKTDFQGWKKEIIKKAKSVYPKTVVNSPENQSIPEIINLSFPGFSSEDLIYRFDSLGIAVSAGSACEAKALQASHVLLATGLPESVVNSAVRLSFNRNTRKQEFEYLLGALEKILVKK